MWISYPQFLWITYPVPLTMWIVWISYPQKMWISLINEIHQKQYDNLCTFFWSCPHFCLSYPLLVARSDDNNITFDLFYLPKPEFLMWIMWITYPQFLWISWERRFLCG